MRPTRRLELVEFLLGAHIGPDEAAAFARRIGFLLAIERQASAFGLAGLIEDVAVDVEFPAVIQAAQSAFLVAPERERRAAVQAALAENTQASLRIAEHDEVFAQHPGAHRRAIGFRDLLRKTGRQPMAAHDAAHRPVAFDAGQEFVVFPGDHGGPSEILRSLSI